MRPIRHLPAISGLLCTLTFALRAPAAEINWDGSCGDNRWYTCCGSVGSKENNFDTGQGDEDCPPYPGAGDMVSLGSADVLFTTSIETTILGLKSEGFFESNGPLEVTGDAELAEFKLFGGTFAVGGQLTIGDSFLWTLGTLELGGESELSCPITINTSGSGVALFGTLTTSGSVERSAGSLTISQDAVYQNDGSFTIKSTGDFGGKGRFINNGSIVKREGAGRVQFSSNLNFENAGGVTVETGTLEFDCPGTSTGSFSVADGASVSFSTVRSEFVLKQGSSLGGDGLYTALNQLGSLVIEAGAQIRPKNLRSSQGLFQVDGTLEIENLDLDQGDFSGAGETRVTGILSIDGGSGALQLDAHRFEVTGRTEWEAVGNASLKNGSKLINGGIFEFQENADFFGAGDDNELVNGGTMSKLPEATKVRVLSPVRFVNDEFGSLDIQAGTFEVRGGSTKGAISIQKDGVLSLTSGEFRVETTTLVGGEGILNVTGTAELVVPFDTTFSVPNLVVDQSADISTAGSVQVNGDGKFTWIGATLTGPGGIQVFGAAEILPANHGKSIEAFHTLNFRGETSWSGGVITITDHGALINRGTFGLQAENLRLDFSGSDAGRFENDFGGTLNVSNSARFVGSGGLFRNSGQVNVEGATFTLECPIEDIGQTKIAEGELLILEGGSTQGVYAIGADSIVTVADDTLTLRSGARFDGDGFLQLNIGELALAGNAEVVANKLRMNAGASRISGDGTLTISNALNWQAGTIGGEGDADPVVISEGEFNLTSSADKTLEGLFVENHGEAFWDKGRLVLKSGTFDNHAGGVFNDLNAANATISGAGVFENAGAFNKHGDAVTTISSEFFNLGSVDVNAGTLLIKGPGNANGTFTAFPGASVDFRVADPGYRLESGATFLGTAPCRFTGGLLDIAGDVVASSFVLDGGTLTGDGTFRVTNSLSWSGTEIDMSGELRSEGSASVFGTAGKRLRRGTFVNVGECTWTQEGSILIGDPDREEPAELLNDRGGTFVAQGGSGGIAAVGKGGEFDNEGTFVVSANDDFFLTRVAVPFANSRLVRLENNAILELAAGGSSTGRFAGTDTTILIITDELYNFDQGTSFSEQGFVRVQDILSINADVTIPNCETQHLIIGAGNLTITKAFVAGAAGGTVRGPGPLTIESGAVLRLEGLTIDNRQIENRGTVEFGNCTGMNDAWILNAGVMQPRFPAESTTLGGGDGFRLFNHGKLVQSTGFGEVTEFDIAVENRGQIRCEAGTMVFSHSFAMHFGSVEVAFPGIIDFRMPITVDGGRIGGNSKANIARLTNKGGILIPGESPGTFTLNGDYEQGPDATMEVELAGHEQGETYDLFIVNGASTLDGTLDVRLLDDFLPAIGDRFTIHTASGGVSGQFATILAQPVGFGIDVIYESDGVTVEVVSLPFERGDLNCDRSVDFADIDAFVTALVDQDAYRDRYPDCDPVLADINRDGSVDFDDIDPFVDCLIDGGCG